MTGYQKKIAYLDYLENGMKIKNAGFVRLEKNGGQTRLELRVKNIPEMFSGQYELKTNAEGVVGRISISRGCGSCCIVWKNGAGEPKGKRTEKAEGVYIRLPGRRLLQAVWDAPMDICVEEREERETEMPAQAQNILQAEEKNQTLLLEKEKTAAPERTVLQEQKNRAIPERTVLQEQKNRAIPERTVLQEQEDGAIPERTTRQEREDGTTPEPAAWQPGERPAVMQPEEEPAAWQPGERSAAMRSEKAKPAEDSASEKDRKPQEMACYGDKWEQLTHMYGVIHPFGDGREYLSIAPKDFVVLRQEYQKMVHNSFLLHGYYNYKHLILGRIREREEWRYYLGVPGNFYGREKMVAEMFGFEAFEGEKEPAKAGDFGYFMKRVEI